MTDVTTPHIADLTPSKYRAVPDELRVKTSPDHGPDMHPSSPTGLGFRIVEIWDREGGFNRFLERHLVSLAATVGMQRKRTSGDRCMTCSRPRSLSFPDW
jgi:hypothetical protein